ncbi:MAG: hypothetical protein Q7J42_16270 [Sulfuritalea sp.]|nr:hypothetical protein [Sulfuritalea sp.]
MISTRTEPGLLAKLFALIAGVVVLVLGFMFSLILLTVVVVLGLGALGYFWWKTRALRKAMRENPKGGRDTGGQVIDGEATVVTEYRVTERIVLPHEPPEK